MFPLSHPPVSFVSTEGEGEVGRYFLKFPQRDVAILIVVVIFHDGLQGATERERRSEKKGPLQPVKERGVLVLLWPVDREGSERGVFCSCTVTLVLTSTICLTCLDMVSGSCLGVTPEPHSATTGGLTWATGCGATGEAITCKKA